MRSGAAGSEGSDGSLAWSSITFPWAVRLLRSGWYGMYPTRPSTMREERPLALHAVRDPPAEEPAPAGRGISGFVHAHKGLTMLTVLVALGLVPSLASEVAPGGELRTRTALPDARYASQGGSSRAVRASHVKARSDEDVDSAVETCGGVGIDHLAHKYRLPRDAELVARRFAGAYERAFQTRVYDG